MSAAEPAQDATANADDNEAAAADGGEGEEGDSAMAPAEGDGAPSSTDKESTDSILDRWVEAKRAKDWFTADKLREELRSMGVEPETTRPAHRPGQDSASAGPPAYVPDAATEAKLDEWVSAKRQKDFATADRLREELRAQGVNPDQVRPATAPGGAPHHGGGGGGAYGGGPRYGHYDPGTEAKTQAWVQAKRVKDFATADRLRDELRAQGVNPEQPRGQNQNMGYGGPPPPHGGYGYGPPAHAPPPPQARAYDPATEGKLNQWVNAKRGKDFATADRLRTELRAYGVDPDIARPATRPGQAPAAPPPHGSYGHPPPGYHHPHGPPPAPYGHGGGYGAYPPPPYGHPHGGGYDPHGGYGGPPPHYAPPHHAPPYAPPGGGGGGGGGGYDPVTEAKLTHWVQAKRQKDFATADRLREELRAQGIDPDTARPAHPSGHAAPSQHGGYQHAGNKRPRADYDPYGGGPPRY